MMRSDCYEKGHAPDDMNVCAKCGRLMVYVKVGDTYVPHDYDEADRLWHGVDREAAKILTKEER